MSDAILGKLLEAREAAKKCSGHPMTKKHATACVDRINEAIDLLPSAKPKAGGQGEMGISSV